MRWQGQFERGKRPSMLISYLCNLIYYFQTACMGGGKIMYSPLLFIIGGILPPAPPGTMPLSRTTIIYRFRSKHSTELATIRFLDHII